MPQEPTSFRVKGYVLVLGDNVDTDTIIPARFLHLTDPARLAEGVFTNTPEIRKRFDKLPKPVVIVAGRGFGYGSSREHAPIALRAAGVAAVLAESFHRIFYRNAINNGLLVAEAPMGLNRRLMDGDPVVIEITPQGGYVDTPYGTYPLRPLPGYILSLLSRGGLREELRRLASTRS